MIATSNARLIDMLRTSRARTLDLVAGLDAEQLMGPSLAIVNPLLWEIGHVAWFQEHFILRGLGGRGSLLEGADALYDSAAIPHDDRWHLPLPSLDATLDYMAEVGEALVRGLADPLSDEAMRLYRTAIHHEDMHDEAFTYSRQTLAYPAPVFARADPASPVATGPWPGDVDVPGGAFQLGSRRDEAYVFDNEKWAHPVHVAPFSIARAPVTNAEFAAFVADGGYFSERFWSREGWRWRTEVSATRPLYWEEAGAGHWSVRRFDRIEPLAPHQPVVHVNWHEANAWCRWANRRLPGELEWEVAATTQPTADGRDSKRRFPWGDTTPTAARANLDGFMLGCVDVAACPDGDSAWGCRQMIGNVWEWTSSTFAAYPGFSADAYKDYSEPWFGTRKVLRGGAWATRSQMITSTYRNFFTPERRDVLAGFRTVAL